MTPLGFDSNKFLLEQDFDEFGKMVELKMENTLTVFKNAIQDCEGKLVEFRNLFNLNEKNINASTLLMKFNADLEKYNSNLNTEFERDIMYQDAQNLIPNGKFVFLRGEINSMPKSFLIFLSMPKRFTTTVSNWAKRLLLSIKRAFN